jgi:hypothetical protein
VDVLYDLGGALRFVFEKSIARDIPIVLDAFRVMDRTLSRVSNAQGRVNFALKLGTCFLRHVERDRIISPRSAASAMPSVVGPSPQQVRVALRQQIHLRRLAELPRQPMPGGVEVEQELALGRIADEASHPRHRCEARAPRDLGDSMQRRRRIERGAAGGQLDRALTGREVGD